MSQPARGRSRPALLAAAIIIAAIAVSASVVVVAPSLGTTVTKTEVSTKTSTLTANSTALAYLSPFQFLTSSGICTTEGVYAPCWGGVAYVFNCTFAPNLLAGPGQPQECVQQVTSTIPPNPSYTINVTLTTSGQRDEPPWANCRWAVAGAAPGEGYAQCVAINSTSVSASFIMGDPAPPHP